MQIRRILLICFSLFALNAIICAPLFRIEYLDDFQSNEGSFITFSHFLLRWWPHVSWFPWFNAGMSFEDTYFPFTSITVAIVSFATRISPAHAFHFLSAVSYSLAPVFLFLFARRLSGNIAASAWAGVLWSLFSPSALYPDILRDMGTPWGMRRLQNIVFWGETPHNLALCLLLPALLLIDRAVYCPASQNSRRSLAFAALAAAAVMLTNAFGVVDILIASAMLFAARGTYKRRNLVRLLGILAVAWLAVCRALTPSLIRLVEHNSQLVGGDYRFSAHNVWPGGAFLGVMILVWAVARRANITTRFALLFTVCFGGITFLAFHNINLVPQPSRYHIEMEAGFCLLIAFAADPLLRGLPRRGLTVAALVAVIPLTWVASRDYGFARRLIHSADISQWTPYHAARWLASILPGQRVLVEGEGQWLFNLFTENPQLSGGHDPSAPNFMQRVAVYTIYSGANAGSQDRLGSLVWLKVFGCGAVVVPGPDSKDHFHAIANPAKFDGLLPLVWRESGESIYRVPLRSPSLAYVIPRDAVVAHQPAHGLDLAPVLPYVAALDNPSAPDAVLAWRNPEHGVIRATVPLGDVISVQMTYDPGWHASVSGRKVRLTADALGSMVIDPECTGPCSIDLDFSGGPERTITLALSLLTIVILVAAAVWP